MHYWPHNSFFGEGAMAHSGGPHDLDVYISRAVARPFAVERSKEGE